MLSDRDRVSNFLQDYDLYGTAAYTAKFADLLKQAREAERHECAKLADNEAAEWRRIGSTYVDPMDKVRAAARERSAMNVAEAIRARNQ